MLRNHCYFSHKVHALLQSSLNVQFLLIIIKPHYMYNFSNMLKLFLELKYKCSFFLFFSFFNILVKLLKSRSEEI